MRLRIFVIDDEEGVRDFLKNFFESLGHEVFVAEEPHVCEIYHGCDCSQPYPCGDLLIIDQNMQTMKGLDFIRFMHERGCKGNPAHKFIFTGQVSNIDMDAVREIGCNVLEKPAELTTLMQIVDRVIANTPEDRKLNDLTP